MLVKGNELPDNIKDEISYIKPSKVYTIGLQGVISSSVEKQVLQISSISESNIVRIGGGDRFSTSLEVAKYFNLTGNIVCLATGNDFADAISGSLYAAKNNAPIILIDKNLSDDEMNYLKNKKMLGVTILGGENTVSKEIQQKLSQIFEH